MAAKYDFAKPWLKANVDIKKIEKIEEVEMNDPKGTEFMKSLQQLTWSYEIVK